MSEGVLVILGIVLAAGGVVVNSHATTRQQQGMALCLSGLAIVCLYFAWAVDW